MMIRALFGGSFDPVHNGHVALVHHLLDSELAHEIHVVPAWHSPHKAETSASAFHRLTMVQLAFNGDKRVVVDDREVASGAPCYSYDTLNALHGEFPNDQWRLVIGADNLPGFHLWHRYAELLNQARLILVARDNHSLSTDSLQSAGLREEMVILAPNFSFEVSATSIRQQLSCIEKRESVWSDLPAPVAEYVQKHDLYLSTKTAKDAPGHE